MATTKSETGCLIELKACGARTRACRNSSRTTLDIGTSFSPAIHPQVSSKMLKSGLLRDTTRFHLPPSICLAT